MILTKTSVMPNSKYNLSEGSKLRKSMDSKNCDLDELSADFNDKNKKFISMLSLLETTQTDKHDSREKLTEVCLINAEITENEISGETNIIAEISNILPENINQVHSKPFITQIQSYKLSEPLDQISKECIDVDIETIDSEDMIIKGQKNGITEPDRNEPLNNTDHFIKAVKQSIRADFNSSAEETTKAQIITETTENAIGRLKQESANKNLPMDLVVSDIAGKTHNLMHPKRQEEHTVQRQGDINLLLEDDLISSYYQRVTTITNDSAAMMTDEGDLPKHIPIEPDSGNSLLNISTEAKPGKTFQFNPVSNEIRMSDKSFRADLLNQVVEKISPGLKAGQSEIRIDIKPESMGRLHLQVSMDQNLVNVKILAEKSLVKEMIESQITLLKTELLQLGIKIDKVNVDLLMPGGSNLANTQNDGSGFKRASKEFEAGIWQKESRDVEILESDHIRVYDRSDSAVNCFA